MVRRNMRVECGRLVLDPADCGLMTDDEWAIVAPFLIIASLRGGRPPANHRRVLDGVFW